MDSHLSSLEKQIGGRLEDRKPTNLLDDFEHIPPTSQLNQQNDDLLGFNHDFRKAATIDFMAAERQQPPPPTSATAPVPHSLFDDEAEQPLKSSIYDDIKHDSQVDKLHEPVAEHNLKGDEFNSSEDLLGDFDDAHDKDDEVVSHRFDAKAHSGVEDLLFNDKPAVSVRSTVEPVVKPAEPIVEKPIEKPVLPAPPAVPASPVVASPPEVPVAKPVIVEAPVAPRKEVSIPSKPKDAPPQRPPKKENMILADEIFYKIGLDAWFNPDRLHPKVEGLIYWRDVKKSGIVFGAGIVFLLAVSIFSVISVFAYSSLLALAAAVSFRIYKTVMQAVQKTTEGHPFQEYLETDLSLPADKVQELASVGVAHVNALLAELRRLFLVEDLIDSIKFGALLWGLTYLGSWFNGMTLVILGFVALFTFPKIYENNKQEIDAQLNLVRSKIQEVTEKIKAAIPIGKKPAVAAESEKDK